MCLMSYANNKGADQPAHPRSLISAFVVRCLDSIIFLDSNGIIYNDSLYTTDLYISAYNILVCETIVDQDQQRCNR